jgi:hypothetical protein
MLCEGGRVDARCQGHPAGVHVVESSSFVGSWYTCTVKQQPT